MKTKLLEYCVYVKLLLLLHHKLLHARLLHRSRYPVTHVQNCSEFTSIIKQAYCYYLPIYPVWQALKERLHSLWVKLNRLIIGSVLTHTGRVMCTELFYLEIPGLSLCYRANYKKNIQGPWTYSVYCSKVNTSEI